MNQIFQRLIFTALSIQFMSELKGSDDAQAMPISVTEDYSQNISEDYSMRNRPIIVDVDTGRDDAWALFGALENFEVLGVVSTYGNVPLDHAFQNSQDIVSYGQYALSHISDAERELNVWQGAVSPMGEATPIATSEIARRADVNGNGLCNLDVPDHFAPENQINAVTHHNWPESMVNYLIHRTDAIDYVACGPLTNLALLIEEFGKDPAGQPRILNHIHRVIAMGGSLDPDLAVDFNFKADPRAVQLAMETFGERLILVPYDETRKLRLETTEIMTLRPDSLAAEFSRQLMLAHAEGWSRDNSILLHDPATLLVFDADNSQFETVPLRMQLDGDLAGKTLIDNNNGTNIRVYRIPEGQELQIRNHLLENILHLRL